MNQDIIRVNENLFNLNLIRAEKQICVYLKPCNEKQDLNYFEKFVGTPKQIINRSLEIINGLKMIFKGADFSIKIENTDLTQMLYLDSETIFDNNFIEFGNVEDYLNN